MSLPNLITRAYLKKYSKTLQRIRHNSAQLQSRELHLIQKSTIYKALYADQDLKSLPISTYKNVEEEIQKKISSNTGKFQSVKTYAKSAGTSSNQPKYIPTSDAFLQRNHVQAAWLTMSLIYQMRPDMDIISRKNLLIGGAIYDSTNDLIIADISGLMIRNIPKVFHKYYVPSIAEATEADWEKKLQLTAQRAAATDQVVMFAGVPTWILTVATEVMTITGTNDLSQVWPYFKVYLHGGVDFHPYRAQFNALFPDNDVLYLDVYNASEGFFAVQDMITQEGMLLLTAHGIYYEFVELENFKADNHLIIPLEEVELGVEYVILISNLSGLIRYVLGDTLIFASLNPYRINITGRITEFINAFGEDLTFKNVKKALAKAQEQFDFTIADYTIAPRYLSTDEKGCHEWYIEFKKEPADLSGLSQLLDDGHLLKVATNLVVRINCQN